MRTGADAIAHGMGWDAVPSVMAQEPRPVGQCHAGVSLCRGKRGPRVKVELVNAALGWARWALHEVPQGAPLSPGRPRAAERL